MGKVSQTELGEILGMSHQAVNKMIQAGKIPPPEIVIGKQKFFSDEQVALLTRTFKVASSKNSGDATKPQENSGNAVASSKNSGDATRQNLDEIKQKLKFIPAETMENRGIVQPARHSGHICPFCRDGSGRDGTGISNKMLSNGLSWYCGKCAKAYDNLDLLAAHFGKDIQRDFREVIELGADLFNIYSADFSTRPAVDKEFVPDKYKNFIINANKRLKSFVDRQGGHWRHLTFDTLNRYFCGYADCYGMRGEPSLPHVILPTSFNQYLARLVGKAEDYPEANGIKISPKPHHGPKEIFGLKLALNDDPIIFLVEGEIDAMSIWQASSFNVIAICGSSLNDNMRDQLKHIGSKNFIVLLDNDPTGRDKAPLLVNALTFIGHNAASFSLSDTHKDANDFLAAEPDAFADRLKQIYDDAQKFFVNAVYSSKDSDVTTKNSDNLVYSSKDSDDATKNSDNLVYSSKDSDVTTTESSNDAGFSDTENYDLIYQQPDYHKQFTKPCLKIVDELTNEKISEWEKINGKINPDVLEEIFSALDYLNGINKFNLSADVAQSSATKRALALCKFYDVFSKHADRFFITLNAAKSLAKNAINMIKAEGDEFVDTPTDNLEALINISLREFRADVVALTKDFAKSHKAFLKDEKQKRANERYQQKRAQETERLADIQTQLEQLRAENPSPERDAALVQLILQSCEWRLNNRQEPVEVKAVAANADKIFTYDPTLDGLTGYDEFQQAYVFLKPPPWCKDAKFGDEWKDHDDAHLRNYLRRTYTEFSNKNLVDDWLTEYAKRRSFHEVKDFFRNLPKWDGTPRAETLFIKFLKADDTPYTREVTLNWLTAAIARIFHAGCEYQLAPILLGEQGIGKSYIINRLGSKWYGSLVDDVADPHAIDAIQKLWLVEVKEMASMKKDVDANKRFIDAAEDTRRAAYERRATKIPRHCVFIITTNNRMCLSDLTGNRRFPVIFCHGKSRNYVTGLSDKFIAQIWAEVYAHYNELFIDGFDPAKLELSKAAQIQSDEVAEQFIRDDLGEDIKSFLDTKIPPDIIWRELSKDERRRFFTDGNIKLVDGRRDLNIRIRARCGRKAQKIIDDLYGVLNSSNTFITEHEIKRNGEELTELWIYGSEYRQHICPAEIFNEAFDKADRRKSIPNILAALNRIGGWSQGKRLQKTDPVYQDQKIVYYRDDNNLLE
ncbi:MAG: toprim domain-containing protein [Selenomonadaceae bacterium]|nr:toprim domain-containing protein [Selenomonadaceae bacterium]